MRVTNGPYSDAESAPPKFSGVSENAGPIFGRRATYAG